MEDVIINLEENTLEKLGLTIFLKEKTKSYEFSLHNSNYKVKLTIISA